jgi:hypothetical protein
MLVVAYKINETLVENYNKDDTNCSAIILMIVTISIVGGIVTWVVL